MVGAADTAVSSYSHVRSHSLIIPCEISIYKAKQCDAMQHGRLEGRADSEYSLERIESK